MANKPKAGKRIKVSSSSRRSTAMDERIGVRLRARRLEMHISQNDLAERLGVSFQQVQKYEKGVNRIGSSRLVEIAEILQVETNYFLADLKTNGKHLATASRFTDFLATKDGLDITEAMIVLDGQHRRSVIDLARALVSAYYAR